MKKTYGLLSLILFLLIACESTEPFILFSSNRNGNSDIFLMKLDGSSVQQITNSQFEEWGAVWVNKDEISFLRQLDSGIVRINKNLKTDQESEVSHPESCILDDKNAIYQFGSNVEAYTCNGEVYCKSGTGIISLTDEIEGIANYPAWSSNGNELLVTSNHNGSNDLYSIELTTKKLMQLTSGPSNDERGDLSPNGELLAFSTDRFEKGNQDIAVKNLKTQEVIRLTDNKGYDLIARWAGDNQTLLIGSNSSGNWEIYSLNINNKELIQLTENDSFDGDPRILIE